MDSIVDLSQSVDEQLFSIMSQALTGKFGQEAFDTYSKLVVLAEYRTRKGLVGKDSSRDLLEHDLILGTDGVSLPVQVKFSFQNEVGYFVYDILLPEVKVGVVFVGIDKACKKFLFYYNDLEGLLVYRFGRERASINGGKAVFYGSRLGIDKITRRLDAGEEEASILDDHPSLKPKDFITASKYGKPYRFLLKPGSEEAIILECNWSKLLEI